jgi:hypothetical protein
MSCPITITGDANINCNDVLACYCGFLRNDQNKERVSKCDISSYYAEDVTSDPEGDFHIVFKMKNGNIIVWKFFTAAERDTVLANIDNVLTTTDV